jgi:DNA polymerase-3 subunit epsilon
VLNITRPIVCLDCEATGIDPQKDRIIELAFVMQYPDGRPEKEWSMRINPGIPIPPASTKIHGITDADVAGKPAFKQLAANLAKGFTDCDYLGMNVRYDLRLLAAEMLRAGVTWNYVGARIVDAYQLERLAVPRSLSHLHEKYVGMRHDGAHGALSDVRAAATVIAKQLEAHDALPRDLDKLHEMSWPGWLCDGGQFKMIEGVATCCFGKKWNGRAMKDIDVGYFDWILGQDFSADVKHLAAEAKMGRFPK